MNIDRTKNLYEITDINELQEYLKVLLDEIAKSHPRYPEYEYKWKDGKFVEVKICRA